MVLSVIGLTACRQYPVFSGKYDQIEVGPGPEDIALDTVQGMERIIISCSQRRTDDFSQNGFYDYRPKDGSLNRLKVVGLPVGLTIHPHGIDIAFWGGKKWLYSVNHERNADAFPPKGRQSILLFELLEDSLMFKEQITGPLLISPNDVCADGHGGLYVANDSGKGSIFFEKLLELRRSYVLHFDGTDWAMVGRKLKYANGVGVRGDRLYMTGTQEKNVISYRIVNDTAWTDRTEIPCLKGNDNITFYGNKLITTAHLDFLKFLKHVKHSEKHSPAAVYSIDLNSEKIDTLYLDNGAVLSAASAGLIFQDNLYIAQVFNPYILRIPLKH